MAHNDPSSEVDLKDGGQALLARIINDISKGKISALDDLYAFPAKPGVNSESAELAESLGMILIKLETRGFHLEQAARVEERLKGLNELKNEYLGIAAHDLRNPISSIRGMSQMLVEMELDDETKNNFLGSIYRVSNQMLALVNNLLDVAVIESGKFELKLMQGNMSSLASERAELIATVAREKGIEIETKLETVVDNTFDADRLGQVVDNLLSNAVKFSPSKSTVLVSCDQVEDHVEISVSDHGPGIPEDELDKLFGTFQKLSVQPTAGEKSTGLGLSIVKRVVDAHGGTVSVSSKVGEGTTFTVAIPLDTTP